MRPARSVQPVQLVQPARPTQPTQPVQLVKPARPTRPVQPTQLMQPAQPTRAVQLAQPTRAVQLAQPAQPTRFAQPAQPARSTRAACSTRPAHARSSLLALLLALCLAFCGCGAGDGDEGTLGNAPSNVSVQNAEELTPGSLPAYSGSPYVIINDNEPAFTSEDKARKPFESYAPLDALGRCGTAFALVGDETMPTEERESISEVHPSGWHSSRYSWIDGESLYNRCHLLGFQLTGENANERNLITGTRYLNAQGMLPFEEGIAQYVDKTGNHVLYRVTPVFEGANLVASGVHMEALSVEDNGAGVRFNVYCYNVQPGIAIDYATGDNWGETAVAEGDATGGSASGATGGSGNSGTANGINGSGVTDGTNGSGAAGATGNADGSGASSSSAPATSENAVYSAVDPQNATYVLNTNTHKFHRPSCSSVGDMKEKNCLYTAATRDQITAAGFEPCKRCNP